MDWDLSKAVAKPLNRDERARLMRSDQDDQHTYALYAAFCDPPYGTRFSDDTPQALFSEWLDLLGLEDGTDGVVLSWVDNFNLNWTASDEYDPARASWSDYFDDGLEWWGVWCLSILEPQAPNACRTGGEHDGLSCRACSSAETNVGASLLAMASTQPASMSADPTAIASKLAPTGELW